MKKLYVVLLLFTCSCSLFAQDREIFNEALHEFSLYHYEGKAMAKQKADSLITLYFKEFEPRSDFDTDGILLKILLSPSDDIYKNFNSAAINSTVKKDKKFQAFKNIYRYQENNKSSTDEVVPLITDSLYIEQIESSFKSLYFTLWANNLYSKKKYEKAVLYAKRALNILKSDGEYKAIQIHKLMGACHYMEGKREMALVEWKTAYELAQVESPLNHRLLDNLTWNIAVIHFSNSEYSKAIPYLLEAVKHFEIAHGNKPYLISKYAVLADAYFYTFDLKRAEIAALKAKSLAEEVIKTDDAYLLGLVASTMSRIYAKQGRFDEARKLLEPALQNTIISFGEGSSLAAAFTSDMAKLEWKAENYELAKTYFQKSIDMSQMTDRVYTKTAALNDMVYFLVSTDQHSEARKYIQAEKDLLIQNNDTLSIIYNVNKLNLIRVLVAEGNLEKAEKLLKEQKRSLEEFTNVEDVVIDNLQYSLLIQYKKFLKTNDIKYLEDAYSDSNLFLEKLIQQKSTLNYDTSKIFYGEQITERIPSALDIIYETIKMKPSSKEYTQALRYMEINKSSTLLNGLKQSTLAETYGIDDRILSEKDSLSDKLSKIATDLNDLVTEENFSETKTQLIDEQLRIQKQIDVINEKIKVEFPAYFNASTLSLSEDIAYYQKNILEKNEVVLEYFLSSNNLYRLKLSKEDIAFDKILNTEKLSTQLESFRNSIINQLNVDKEIKSLSSVLLPELSKNISRLTIIADGALGTIPFEILMQNEKMLLEICPVRYAGSLQLLDEQMKTRSQSNKNWAGFAPSYKDNILRNNENEVTTIKETINGELSLLGKEATKINFIKSAANYKVIHLAVHGFLDQVNPMNNGLLFSDETENNELSIQEIYGLSLNARLAVLSACNTGSGKYEKGDGIMSLSRAFNYAGVSSTVVSLWEVPDRETSQIMIGFYKYLEEGESKDVALQKAKLDYLASTDDGALKHPFYWSGFIIIGDVTPLESGLSYWWIVLGIGVLALLIFLFWTMQKRAKISSINT